MNSLSKIIAFFTLLLLPFFALTQNGSFTGLGNSSVMLYDFWAINNNQAGLADIESPEIGVCYDYNYQMWQTGIQTIGFVLPTKSGNFAFSGSRYGYSGYSENGIGLAYSRNLGKMFSTSLQFDYLFFNQGEYGFSGGALTFEVGLISRPIENLQIGLHIYNPAEYTFDEYEDDEVPTIIRFGLGYYFGKQVMLSVETEKDIDDENRFKTGLQYEPIEHFFIRTGFLSNPNQFSLGIGFAINKFTTDIAITTHESLAMSSQISFKYKF